MMYLHEPSRQATQSEQLAGFVTTACRVALETGKAWQTLDSPA